MSDPASTTAGCCCSPGGSEEAQAPTAAEAPTGGTAGEKAPEVPQQVQPVAATFGRCC